jgi:dUTP pyrophosphatase
MTKPVLKFKKLRPDAQIPAKADPGSSGLDLRTTERLFLSPGEMVMAPTGLASEIPPGYEVQIRPRSGIAAKQRVTVLNSPGICDSSFRGEWKVLLFNHSNEIVIFDAGDRIAQAALCPVPEYDIQEVTELSETTRGSGGFGSTGVK